MIKSILLNSGSNLFVLFLKIGLTFIMAPIFINNLGKYDYGLWEMFGAVLGYMGMLDLGLGPAVSRYAAMHRGDGDRLSQQQVFNSAVLFMCAVGLLLAGAFVIWSQYFPGSIAPEGAETQKYAFLLLVFAAQVLIFFPGRVAESYLEGFQKYQIKNLIIIVNSIIGTIILYNYISPENGLVLLATVNMIGGSIKYVIYMYFISRPSIVGLRYSASDFSLGKLKELLFFGAKSLVQGIATRIENATDSIVIGIFLGPAIVPLYSIPANLVQYVRTLGHTLTHVFMPLFSTLVAKNETSKVQEVYIKGSKFTVSAMSLLCVGAVMFGPEFIGIWIGNEFVSEAKSIILLLVMFTAVPFIDPFSSRYLTAIGQHGIFAKWMPVSALINLGLSLSLVSEYGIVGVAFASVVPVFIFVPIFLRKACNSIGFSVRYYVGQVLVPVFLPSVVMCLVAYLFKFHNAIGSYGTLLVGAFVSSTVFVLSYYVFGMSRDEKNGLRSLLKNRVE